MTVAECLKSIDESLQGDFFAWGNCRYSMKLLECIWDLVPPVACDLHQLSTFTRLTIMKLLSPESDYEKQLANALYKKFVDKKEIENDVKATDIYSYLKTGTSKFKMDKSKVVLDKYYFRYFCTLIGVNLKESEINNVFKAFDTDNSKTISYDEFIEFTGQKGDISEAMNKKCIWETSCKFCGMPVYKDEANAELVSHKVRLKNKYINDLHKIDFETPKKCERSLCDIETKKKNIRILRYLAYPQILLEKQAARLTSIPIPAKPKLSYEIVDGKDKNDYMFEEKTGEFSDSKYNENNNNNNNKNQTYIKLKY